MSNQRKKLKRNDLCYCGSGKKYKHCHMRIDQAQQRSLNSSTTGVPQTPVSMNKSFWKVLAAGSVVAAVIGSYWGKGIIFAGAWMILYSVARSLMRPPAIKENAGDPAALDFGRK